MNYSEHEYVTPKEYVRVGSLITRDAIYRLAKACRDYAPLDSIFQKHGRKLYVHPDLLTRLLELLKANDLINHNHGIELTDAQYILERYTPTYKHPKEINLTPLQFVPPKEVNQGLVDRLMSKLYNDTWPQKIEAPLINHTRIVDLASGSKFYLMRFHEERVTVHEINKMAFNHMFKAGEEKVLRPLTGNNWRKKDIGIGSTTKNYLWTICKDGMIFYNVREEIVEELLNKCGESVGCL